MDEKNKALLLKGLSAAWKRYTLTFAEAPHGTDEQIAALIEMIPSHIPPPDLAVKPATPERVQAVVHAALQEAVRHYGDKFALALVVAYKEVSGGPMLVDVASNVSAADQCKLHRYALEAAAIAAPVANDEQAGT